MTVRYCLLWPDNYFRLFPRGLFLHFVIEFIRCLIFVKSIPVHRIHGGVLTRQKADSLALLYVEKDNYFEL